jgi:hypothetical protein
MRQASRFAARFGTVLAAILALLVLFASTASAQRAQTLDPGMTAKADGPAGLKWIGGDRESPFMHPGLDCIACHAKGEGPKFQVAGTVYAKVDEKDDYFGVEGVSVQLTDSKGVVATLATNKAGNFYSGRGASLSLPLSVKLLSGKAERVMGMKAPMGDCASCHTATGKNGAPGRIMAP